MSEAARLIRHPGHLPAVPRASPLQTKQHAALVAARDLLMQTQGSPVHPVARNTVLMMINDAIAEGQRR
jgi:hypothetical protein